MEWIWNFGILTPRDPVSSTLDSQWTSTSPELVQNLRSSWIHDCCLRNRWRLWQERALHRFNLCNNCILSWIRGLCSLSLIPCHFLLYYYNVIYMGLPLKTTQKLQLVSHAVTYSSMYLAIHSCFTSCCMNYTGSWLLSDSIQVLVIIFKAGNRMRQIICGLAFPVGHLPFPPS